MKRACPRVFILLVALSLQSVGQPSGEASGQPHRRSVTRQIHYSFTLQNKTNHLLSEAEFWTYAPVRETSAQHSTKLEVSHPYELILDDLGNQILHFKFRDLPPFATKIITISAEVEFFEPAVLLKVQDLKPYLQAEKCVESDDPEISRFARRFESPETVHTARDIFHWVAENIKYAGYIEDDLGALYALKKREGDCTEFMSLFVALARANNIPARGIGGYVHGEGSILQPADYHNWAEFYLDGAWRIADPQKKVFMQEQSTYIAMRVIGESAKNPMVGFDRFRFTGEGLIVKMN